IKINDKVVIEKSGEIIPKILSVVKEGRKASAKSIKLPKKCPSCGSELFREKDEVALRCNNISCKAQIKQSILHFASRNAMDIEGLGISLVEKLVDTGIVSGCADLYYLKLSDIKELERFAEKSAQNVIEAIDKSRKNELNRLIFGLGIRHVGQKAAWTLARKFGSIEKLAKENIESLTAINEIGPIMAKSIHDFFKNKKNLEMITKLKNARVHTEMKKNTESQILQGKTFVVTGSLKDYTRTGIQELIRNLGGDASSSVSGRTDYLVAGEDAGSKLEKAKKLGVKIIDENEFKKIIGKQS
ncbi:MAG: helix-hairpin-helix domain-containing protein, partial [Candidatus Omnitrophota bacterium]